MVLWARNARCKLAILSVFHGKQAKNAQNARLGGPSVSSNPYGFGQLTYGWGRIYGYFHVAHTIFRSIMNS